MTAPVTGSAAGVGGSVDRVAVRVIDAAVRLGGRTVWSGVSATVRAGQFAAVLGPNGVGKSTLVKVLLGLVPPAAGTVQVLGGSPGRSRGEVGYLPQ
ncbi:MAG TPA: ATP-binding cassette domain-containing protein, partial [Kineosporiaceae bacterium]|nr:ATP-binding cassette domain-containing protein [Kineosporiaceae bacterium]